MITQSLSHLNHNRTVIDVAHIVTSHCYFPAFKHGSLPFQATSNANLQRVLQKQASLGKRFSTASSTCQQEAAVAVASRLAKNAASKQAMAAAAASPPPPAQQQQQPTVPLPATQLIPPSSCSISTGRKFSASEQQSYSHTETAV